jgi:hypothetical protein
VREPLGERGELRPEGVGGRLRRVLAEQQPVLLLPVEVGGDERPYALCARPVEPEREAAVRFLLEQLVRPVIPDLDAARAVLALRDLARERRVVERVVLDVDREMAFAGAHRQPLRHRPARERAVPLEPQVVVEPPGVVALDDEDRRLLAPPAAAEGLGGS